MTVVDVAPPVLEWARHHSGHTTKDMHGRFDSWVEWMNLQRISTFTHVPLGYLFLPTPPTEPLPAHDFRFGRDDPSTASAELLDTIYLKQRRQAWHEDYITDLKRENPLAFIGSAKGLSVAAAARQIMEDLSYGVNTRSRLRTSAEARNYLIGEFKELGGLAVINSMVDNNPHRLLDLDQFPGFTLHSLVAPLIFVNGQDTKNGQAFSLFHEFTHVWRGAFALSSGGRPLQDHGTEVGRWCDAVAVPTDDSP